MRLSNNWHEGNFTNENDFTHSFSAELFQNYLSMFLSVNGGQTEVTFYSG